MLQLNLLQINKYSNDLVTESGEYAHNRQIQTIDLHINVIMRKHVSKRSSFAPLDIRVFVTNGIWNALSRFTDNLETPSECVLRFQIISKLFESHRSDARNRTVTILTYILYIQ